MHIMTVRISKLKSKVSLVFWSVAKHSTMAKVAFLFFFRI